MVWGLPASPGHIRRTLHKMQLSLSLCLQVGLQPPLTGNDFTANWRLRERERKVQEEREEKGLIRRRRGGSRKRSRYML